MPIEVNIPIEISAYTKKVVFGLTIRQLIALPLAILISLGSYFIFIKGMGMTIDNASWFIIGLAIPPLAIGFIQPGGEPFEQWFSLRIRRICGKQKLYYSAETAVCTTQKEVITYEIDLFPKKQPQASELYWLHTPSGAADRRHRAAQTKKELIRAQQEYKKSQRNTSRA